MILSRYCKIYKVPTDSESVILFSIKNSSKVSVSREMLCDIRTGRLSEDETATLTDLGFLVDSEAEERTSMRHFLEEVNRADRIFSAQLVMNLDCNLNCGYCFEGSRKGKHYMSEETVLVTESFIRKVAPNGIEELRLVFYGGEPLLSSEMISRISGRIGSFAEERGLRYTGKIVTNGTLLTPENAARLAASGIKTASVTLDGPEPVHDASRPFKSGKGSFRAIVKNLKDVCGLLDIEIGGNYTKANYRRFPDLIDSLIAEGLTPDKVGSLQFYPVLQETAEYANCGFNEGCSSLNQSWLYEAEVFLRAAIRQRGYRWLKIVPVVCMMELRNRIIVNHDGALYKCSGFIGRPEFRVGDIRSGISDYRISHSLDSWKNDECLECSYLPLCFGGCRYMKYLRDGNMAGVDCKKPYLDATLEKFVIQDMEYAAAC